MMWVVAALVWVFLTLPVFLMAPTGKLNPGFGMAWAIVALPVAGLLGFWVDQCKGEVLDLFEDLGSSVWAREDLWGRASAEERRRGYLNFVRGKDGAE